MNFNNPPAESPQNVFHKTFYSQLINHEIGYNTDEEAVSYIARDIQSKTYTRDENVKDHDGFVYSTTFYDKSNTALWGATINSADTLVDYHYTYHPDSPLDFAYIQKSVQEK